MLDCEGSRTERRGRAVGGDPLGKRRQPAGAHLRSEPASLVLAVAVAPGTGVRAIAGVAPRDPLVVSICARVVRHTLVVHWKRARSLLDGSSSRGRAAQCRLPAIAVAPLRYSIASGAARAFASIAPHHPIVVVVDASVILVPIVLEGEGAGRPYVGSPSSGGARRRHRPDLRA